MQTRLFFSMFLSYLSWFLLEFCAHVTKCGGTGDIKVWLRSERVFLLLLKSVANSNFFFPRALRQKYAAEIKHVWYPYNYWMSNTLITKFQFKQKRVKLFELLNQTKKNFWLFKNERKTIEIRSKVGKRNICFMWKFIWISDLMSLHLYSVLMKWKAGEIKGQFFIKYLHSLEPKRDPRVMKRNLFRFSTWNYDLSICTWGSMTLKKIKLAQEIALC